MAERTLIRAESVLIRRYSEISRDIRRYPVISSDPSSHCESSRDFSSFSSIQLQPAVGARIGWELPPQLAKVLPNSRAARVGTELRPGDELVEAGDPFLGLSEIRNFRDLVIFFSV